MNEIQNIESDNRQARVAINVIYCAVSGQIIEGDYIEPE